MCSVVEIKNESEYYIYYHSPESLETVASQHQSLEYQHLFRLRDQDGDGDGDGDEISGDLNAADKDFSVEEIVTPRNRLSSSNDTNNDSDGETLKAVKKEGEVTNGSDQENAVDNDLLEDNELNCEKAPDDIKNGHHAHVENKLQADVNNAGWKTICFVILGSTDFFIMRTNLYFFTKILII